MNLLISHCNSERIDLFGLSCHDLENDASYWVDLRSAGLDPHADIGLTGLCYGPELIYVGVQSLNGGKILVLDRQLNFQEMLYLRHAEDIHALALHDNSLYVTSTRSNAIIRFETDTRNESVFWQHEQYVHLNDVKFHNDECYLLSQDSPGEGVNTGGTVTRLHDGATIITGLDQPHSMWFEDNFLTVLSSRKGDAIRVDLSTLEASQLIHVDGYARGIWCEQDRIYIATSAERLHSRKQGPGKRVVDDIDTYLVEQHAESNLYAFSGDGGLLAKKPLTTLNFEAYDLLALTQWPAAERLMARPEVVKAQYLRQQRSEELLAVSTHPERPPAEQRIFNKLPAHKVGMGLYAEHYRRFLCYADHRDDFVRGAWYFSDGWPVNFWSHVEKGKVRRELAAIKAMGFNAIFILVPWRGFQPDPLSATCCRKHRKRARTLLRACDRLKLRVYARVSYGHAMCPNSIDEGHERVEKLLSDDRVLNNWLAYLSSFDSLKRHKSLTAFFLCWEDFWHSFSSFQRRDSDQRRQLAAGIGYQDYVQQHHGLETYNKAGFSSEPVYRTIDDIEIPLDDSARHGVYLRFINFRLRELFERARNHISPLTMEIRVDKDVTRDRDGRSHWFEHDNYEDLHLPTMSYWAPFVGAKNDGEQLSLQQALNHFEFQLRQRVRHADAPPPLINQFNFVDTTPEFAAVHAHIDPEQVVPFLGEVSSRLLSHSSGYALWALRNYYQSLLYNGSFALSGKGWDVTPRRRCRFRRVRGETEVKVSSGATLSQTLVPAERGMVWIHKVDKLVVRIDFPGASVGREKHLRVSLAGHTTVDIKTSETSATKEILFSQTHHADEPLTLELQNVGDACSVQRICLYNYEFESHILDARGRPTEYAQAIEALNQEIRDERRVAYADRAFLPKPAEKSPAG